MSKRYKLLSAAVVVGAVLLVARPLPALEAGINIDVHQDIQCIIGLNCPNDFHVEGIICSRGGPPVLVDHVDDLFSPPNGTFSYSITYLGTPDLCYYRFVADWVLNPPASIPGIPYCHELHLGLLFDVDAANLMLDLHGWWTRDGVRMGEIIQLGNGGAVPVLGFSVDDDGGAQGQTIRIANGTVIMPPMPPLPPMIPVELIQMDVVAFPPQSPPDFRDLRRGGGQETYPWVPVRNESGPIGPGNPLPMMPDSFFDVFLEVAQPGAPHPVMPITIEPGGFLVARTRIAFTNNVGEREERWGWEMHEAQGPEACCFDDGSCQDLAPFDCMRLGGVPQGIGTTCANTVCLEKGACCYGTAAPQCVVTDKTTCELELMGQWKGVGTDCTDADGDLVADICELQPDGLEFGDAPEQALAYPATGVMGMFPTCITVGPAMWIQHTNFGAWLGPALDFEPDGNAGLCPGFNPYDADECFMDGDAGLLRPAANTINPMGNVVPCPQSSGPAAIGTVCQQAMWGPNIDVDVHNHMPNQSQGFVNVLIDWDQNGQWGGASPCPTGAAPEHVLINFLVPNPYDGPLSGLLPPGFRIGPKAGDVWMRVTITERPVPTAGWDGSGQFEDGETEDYLIAVTPDQPHEFDFGDAPEGALAYPAAGVIGQFPTCMTVVPAQWIQHASKVIWLGPAFDTEPDGNAGLCPMFNPYDADECFADGDAGLIVPTSYTIDAANNVVPCPGAPSGSSLGVRCATAVWGANVDIQVNNNWLTTAYMNVLMDWDQNGAWAGASTCPGGTVAPEHVLVNFPVPPGYVGPLSGLLPPGFVIGPNAGSVWTRFSITDLPVQVPPTGWDGSGSFEDGETEDYLLEVGEEQPQHELGDAPDSTNSIGVAMTAYPAGGPAGILAHFPTVYNIGSPPWGPIHRQPLALAYLGPAVSLENEADIGPDQDGVNNLSPAVDLPDKDAADDGLMGMPLVLPRCCPTSVKYQVTVVNPVPANTNLYVNLWFDWNRDGDWDDVPQCGQNPAPEWAVQNQLLPAGLLPGSYTFNTPAFLPWHPTVASRPIWMRITLAEQPWQPGAMPGWGGSGPANGYVYGETEDYYFDPVVPPNTVAARGLFYRNAGYAPYATALNAKIPLLTSGVRGTLVNTTSYLKGLNQIYVDIAKPGTCPPLQLTAADFTFRVGNNNNVAAWGPAPLPSSVVVTVSGGGLGVDRVTMTWPDYPNAGCLPNQSWLQVTVLPNANTGLAAPDVFYWGILVGNTGLGDTITAAYVTGTDYNNIYNNPHSVLPRQPIDWMYDLNKDGFVTGTDWNGCYNNAGPPVPALNYIICP